MNDVTGVERLRGIFASAREARRGVLMPFVVGGHPGGVGLADLVATLEQAGAGVVEIGFPFSDPVADGGTIAEAMHQTLVRGRSIDDLLDDVRSTRQRVSLGMVAMASVSVLNRRGGASFLRTLAEAGFDGVIVPDLPLEESAPYRAEAERVGLGFTLLIAPSTPPERASEIAKGSSGFVYLLARAGITGESDRAPDISGRVRALRANCDVPIAAGFGISTPEHVRAVVAEADAAIVGSALVRRLGESSDPLGAADSFCRSLAAGLVGP